jgi:hypothetical protein
MERQAVDPTDHGRLAERFEAKTIASFLVDALEHRIRHRIGFARRRHEGCDREHDSTCCTRGNECGLIPGGLGDAVADQRIR